MKQQSSKPLSKKGTLAAAIIWSAGAAIWLVRLILDLSWNEEMLPFQLPFLNVIAAILFLINAILNWCRFARYNENNE